MFVCQHVCGRDSTKDTGGVGDVIVCVAGERVGDACGDVMSCGDGLQQPADGLIGDVTDCDGGGDDACSDDVSVIGGSRNSAGGHQTCGNVWGVPADTARS